MKAHAHQANDIFTSIRIAKEFDVKLTLEHCTEGHLVVEELAKEGYPADGDPMVSSTKIIATYINGNLVASGEDE